MCRRRGGEASPKPNQKTIAAAFHIPVPSFMSAMPANANYRIGKFLAHAGLCSRRDAANFLNSHEVIYEGNRIHELNFHLSPDAIILVNGQPVRLNQSQIVLLNKPPGYVCTHKEQKNQKSIFRLLPHEMSRFFYAGRLDEESRGLVILSNDGDLVFNLTHPTRETTKIYHVHVSRPLSEIEILKITNGIWSKKEKLQVDNIRPLLNPANYEIEIHEGKNREIRRIFDALFLQVNDLLRIKIGEYSIDGITEGNYRIISSHTKEP